MAICIQLAALTAKAKITEAQATTNSLATVPYGTVKNTELELEHGLLVWSFDLSQPSVKGVTVVQVHAKLGEIVSVKMEVLAQETKEENSEKAKKPCQNEWRYRHLKYRNRAPVGPSHRWGGLHSRTAPRGRLF